MNQIGYEWVSAQDALRMEGGVGLEDQENNEVYCRTETQICICKSLETHLIACVIFITSPWKAFG